MKLWKTINNDLTVNAHSMILALFINCHAVNLILNSFFSQYSVLGLPFILVVCALLWLCCIKGWRYTKLLIAFPICLTVFYIFTLVFNGSNSTTSLVELGCYVLLPFVLMGLDFDAEKVVKSSLLITAPGILVLGTLFERNYRGGITMGLSYAFMVTIVCAILYLCLYMKKEKSLLARIIYLACCVIDGLYLYNIVVYGSRGPVLTFLILIAALCVFRYVPEEKALRFRNFRVTMILAGALVLAMVLLVVFIEPINAFVVAQNIEISFITDNLSLLAKGDILDGRVYCYVAGFEEFLNSPIFGDGMGMYLHNTGVVYPHNLFLQLLYDGGIVLLVLATLHMVWFSVKIFRSGDRKLVESWLLLFMLSVPSLMLSGDIWEKINYWMFMALLAKQSATPFAVYPYLTKIWKSVMICKKR